MRVRYLLDKPKRSGILNALIVKTYICVKHGPGRSDTIRALMRFSKKQKLYRSSLRLRDADVEPVTQSIQFARISMERMFPTTDASN